MKKFAKLLFGIYSLLFLFFVACDSESGGGNDNSKKENEEKEKETESNDDFVSAIVSDSYFWGTWIRMDNGTEYDFLEKSVKFQSHYYENTSGDLGSLSVKNLGRFTKQSDSVMLMGNSIPLFRKGGANLEYTLKLVGFADSQDASRAATSSNGVAGLNATGTSENFRSYTNNSTSDTNGFIKLRAPIAGDPQTVVIERGTDNITVSGLKVNNTGDYMGTIPIVEKGSYSLKITGTIADSEKNDGYLYGNNYKSYPLTLSITNISEVSSAVSFYEIEAADSTITVEAASGQNLSGSISTLKPGLTKTIYLTVKCGNLNSAYIDTGLNVIVTNSKTQQRWVDYVPLRFYRGLIPISIAAKSTEGNTSAALNGFVMYPDGNNQFFSVSDNGSKVVYVPTFGSEKTYKLSFSGATVSGTLSDSTEMFYTVAPGTGKIKSVDIPSSSSTLTGYYNFGESNDTEDDAYFVNESFEAYLHEGDIDYFDIIADGAEIVSPSFKSFCTVTYKSDFTEAPAKIQIVEGGTLGNAELPVLNRDFYTFDGWYIGNYKIETGYAVETNITVMAKWIPTEYPINYNINGGTNNIENPTTYTIESDTITLFSPSRQGYEFAGWYATTDYSGTAMTEIPKSSNGEIVLYAKWNPASGTAYTVKHWWQNTVGNEYTLHETDTPLLGTTETQTTASAKEYHGFTVKPFVQQEIKGDGSTIVDVYYDRNIISFTLELDGGTTTTALSNGKLQGKYGAPVSIAVPTKNSYAFAGWNTSGGTLPAYFISDASYTALWSNATVTVSAFSDITVSSVQNGTEWTFTADGGYSTYKWLLDGKVQSVMESAFIVNTATWAKGTYEIVLEASMGSKYRSAIIFITIGE